MKRIYGLNTCMKADKEDKARALPTLLSSGTIVQWPAVQRLYPPQIHTESPPSLLQMLDTLGPCKKYLCKGQRDKQDHVSAAPT